MHIHPSRRTRARSLSNRTCVNEPATAAGWRGTRDATPTRAELAAALDDVQIKPRQSQPVPLDVTLGIDYVGMEDGCIRIVTD